MIFLLLSDCCYPSVLYAVGNGVWAVKKPALHTQRFTFGQLTYAAVTPRNQSVKPNLKVLLLLASFKWPDCCGKCIAPLLPGLQKPLPS